MVDSALCGSYPAWYISKKIGPDPTLLAFPSSMKYIIFLFKINFFQDETIIFQDEHFYFKMIFLNDFFFKIKMLFSRSTCFQDQRFFFKIKNFFLRSSFACLFIRCGPRVTPLILVVCYFRFYPLNFKSNTLICS